MAKDVHALYQAFPLPELTRDATTSTPNQASKDTRSYPDFVVRWNAYPFIVHTPRSFVTSSSSSLSAASMQAMYSPSPFRESQAPSLAFPEISPPSRGSGSTPFERQFISDFPREWNDTNFQISPVSRRDSRSPICHSAFSSSGRNSFRTANDDSDSQDSQDVVERVCLIDKFISAAADIEDNSPLSPSPLQDRSSPLSDISELSCLSSPEFSDDLGRLIDLQTPPTSQTQEGLQESGRSNDQCNDPPARFKRQFPLRRSSPCSPDSGYLPAKGSRYKRKRTPGSRDGNGRSTGRKKARTTTPHESTITDSSSSLGTLSRRRLPTNVPYDSQFSLFYLCFPVSSYVRLADGKFPLLSTDMKCPAGTYNEPRDALDLYTPRFVKGSGVTKVGVCPICIEPPSRGGKGETVWLSMKFSAYKCNAYASSYHLQYAHGISSVSGLPFSPPVSFRTTKRPNAAKNERTSVQEGKCHKCKKWILVESIKNMDIKVKELYWWKHAAACHQGSHIDGDDDFFLDDDAYRWVQEAQ